ncbi:MAG: hypothetical protein ACP5LE_08230 [Thermoplasmata archaeon]
MKKNQLSYAIFPQAIKGFFYRGNSYPLHKKILVITAGFYILILLYPIIFIEMMWKLGLVNREPFIILGWILIFVFVNLYIGILVYVCINHCEERKEKMQKILSANTQNLGRVMENEKNKMVKTSAKDVFLAFSKSFFYDGNFHQTTHYLKK